MKISRVWLQKYFDSELPSTEVLADKLTFHAFEIEEVAGDVLDVNVLPDRAAYALCHRGVAREVAAILNLPMKEDPLRTPIPAWQETSELHLTVDQEGKTLRKMGALVLGVKVGPSPEWLRAAIESMGQRSINNVVDATNYVTLDMGQPLHAFDAGKIARHDGVFDITVRGAKDQEEITVLSGETYKLSGGTLVIAEGVTGTALDIAGVKGGAASSITDQTTDLFVSVCNFDGPTIRRTAQVLNLFTDASLRFQNKISPELVPFGMRDALALIKEVAGGEVVGVNDVYAAPVESGSVVVTLADINGLLGSAYTVDDVSGVFDRLGLSYTEAATSFAVSAPFERRDLMIAEDLVEEVGRVLGYDRIESAQLPGLSTPPDAGYTGIERLRDFMRGRGYSEISTQSFAREGDVMLANPLDKTRPALRARLAPAMEAALERTAQTAPRVLGPVPAVHLFELGSVFPAEGETLSLAIGYRAITGKTKASAVDELLGALKDELGASFPVERVDDGIAEILLWDLDLAALGQGYEPVRIELGPYRPYSIYPFALRDIAVWTPLGTEESEITTLIFREAGDTLVRVDQFDRFEKDGRVSYALRLVFESSERTLSDVDLDPAMESMTAALNAQTGFEVR